MASRRVLSALALLAAIGCGGGDENGPTGSIQLSASPSALTVLQGASGLVTVTLVRGGGFADPVNVAVTGLPSGVTLSVNPAQLTGATTQAVVTVNVASTVPAGTYTATVTATATGIGSATASYTLTVTALPTYALTATPAAVSVGQGGSGTSTIALQRTNFTSAVALTLENPPAGITGSFNPASATADQSVLTINVASTVATGSYNLTVKGTAAGQPDKTTTIALTVTGPANYTLAASAVTINAGATGQSTVTITRTNFTGAVTLSLDAPPAGITATFNPAAPTVNSSVATIAVASTVAPGVYNVTIKGTASGVADKTTTVAVTVAAAASFTIAASPTALSLAPGGSGNSTVTIVRTNLTADIALSLVSPPAGITGVFTPATLTGTTLTSSLAINVASTVAAGVYPITVQGVGGSVTQTAVVTVTVAAGASVSLSVAPATLTIQQGGSSTTTLTATRSNFTGNITPSVTGNPAGMTLTFNPNPITGNSAAVTVNVGSGVAAGTHNVIITGAAGAAGNPTVTLPVTVTVPTGGSNFVWEFCNTDDVPLKFWRLSGTTWTEVAPTVVGSVTRFSFNITSTSGGVAFTLSNTASSVRTSMRTARQRTTSSMWDFSRQARDKDKAARMRITNQDVNQSSPFFDTFVILGLASELSGSQATCVTTPVTVAKTFNVSGMAGTETGQLGYGVAAASLSSATPSYNLNVAAGSYDWMAAFGPAPGFPDLTFNWTAYRIGRNEAAPGAAVAINRTGATAFTTFPFTVTGGAAGSFYLFSQNLQGSRGQILGLPIGAQLGTANTGTMLFLAPGDRLGTDLMSISITNINQVGSVTDFRSSLQYLGSAPPASGSFALPQAVPAFVVSAVAGAPVPTWQAVGPIPTDYQGATSSISASFTGANSGPLYTISATRGWLTANGMSTNFTLAGPTLPGFLAAWAPAAPLDDASVIMFGSTTLTAPVAGSVFNFSFRLQD